MDGEVEFLDRSLGEFGQNGLEVLVVAIFHSPFGDKIRTGDFQGILTSVSQLGAGQESFEVSRCQGQFQFSQSGLPDLVFVHEERFFGAEGGQLPYLSIYTELSTRLSIPFG